MHYEHPLGPPNDRLDWATTPLPPRKCPMLCDLRAPPALPCFLPAASCQFPSPFSKPPFIHSITIHGLPRLRLIYAFSDRPYSNFIAVQHAVSALGGRGVIGRLMSSTRRSLDPTVRKCEYVDLTCFIQDSSHGEFLNLFPSFVSSEHGPRVSLCPDNL
jgi:hypothetical protein